MGEMAYNARHDHYLKKENYFLLANLERKRDFLRSLPIRRQSVIDTLWYLGKCLAMNWR